MGLGLHYVGLLSKEYKAKVLEVEVQKWWEENRVYLKVKELKGPGPKFYFLDGPPYVTNPIHVGTVWNKILKDVVIRYLRMRGFNVRDQPGYDMHGLPIEVMVERNLGLRSKGDLEKVFGVGRFIEECRRYAFDNLKIVEGQLRNLGVWMDWEKRYITITDEYIESVWWMVKEAYRKGLLFKGEKIVHWCPRCETVLSGYEVTEEYRMVKDPSIYVKFPVIGKGREYILIWTTTPWTLPANVAVMVHPEHSYVRVKVHDDVFILAEARCEAVFREVEESYEVLEKFLGKDLEGVRYRHPLIEEVPIQLSLEKFHQVVLSREFVTMEEGTGCVHSAPGHGEEDYQVGLQYGLPALCLVDESGLFIKEAGKYAGESVREANESIVNDLKGRGLLLYEGVVEHRYPHCWRCRTPLILRASTQWFIKVSSIRDRLLKENERVRWAPDWAGSLRFRNWLEGARDWVISRQRYWGTPLPIWVCGECGREDVVGSRGELVEKAVKAIGMLELHKPWIDNVKLRCVCGGEMGRVPDVIDVWMDSGVASWACLSYPAKVDEFKDWWPAKLILEGPDQTRGWFYTLLVCGLVAFNEAPYERVLMHGWSLDKYGHAMHKSLGNVVYPEEVIERYGRDSLRWYELQFTVWEDLKFSMEGVYETFKNLNIIWNTFYFASLYMNLDRFPPTSWTLEKVFNLLKPEDRWLVSRTQKLIKDVTELLERLQIHEAVRTLNSFLLNDVSRWYVKLIRRRTWVEGEDLDKLAAYTSLHHALLNFLILSAPFIPHFVEKIYQEMFKPADPTLPESIHMLGWPKPIEDYLDASLLNEMDIARSIVECSLSIRQAAGVKQRIPLQKAMIVTEDPEAKSTVRRFYGALCDQLNVKNITIITLEEEEKLKDIVLQPNYSKIGPVYRDKAKLIAEALKLVDGKDALRSVKEKGFFELKIDGELFKLTLDYVNLKEVMPEYLKGSSFLKGRVFIDVRISEELMAEGLAREVVRRLQEMRKEMDLKVDAYIDAYVKAPSEKLCNQLKGKADYIMSEVRVKSLHIMLSTQPTAPSEYEKTWEIDGEQFKMGISRI